MIKSLFIFAYFLIFVRYELLSNQTDKLILPFLIGGIYSAVSLLVLIIFSQQIKYIEIVKRKKISVIYIWFAGLLALGMPTLYNIFSFVDKALLVLIGCFSIFLLFKGREFLYSLEKFMPLKDYDLKMLFPTYPPRERLDLIRLDMVLVIMLVMPFIVELFH